MIMYSKTDIPAQNTIENVMHLMIIMTIVLNLMEILRLSTGMWLILLVESYLADGNK